MAAAAQGRVRCHRPSHIAIASSQAAAAAAELPLADGISQRVGDTAARYCVTSSRWPRTLLHRTPYGILKKNFKFKHRPPRAVRTRFYFSLLFLFFPLTCVLLFTSVVYY